MKYMVMECHPGYAVVLDETGTFSKVANMHYEVGQTVTNVVELQLPQTARAKKKKRGWIYSMAATAACLLLVVTGVLQAGNSAYASVYMTINPEVRIDVNHNDTVVGLGGVNADGEALVDGYDHRKKSLDLVVDELVDRSIEMGFLHEGGKITLTLDAEDNEWIIAHEASLENHVQEHLSGHFAASVEITRCGNDHDDDDAHHNDHHDDRRDDIDDDPDDDVDDNSNDDIDDDPDDDIDDDPDDDVDDDPDNDVDDGPDDDIDDDPDDDIDDDPDDDIDDNPDDDVDDDPDDDVDDDPDDDVDDDPDDDIDDDPDDGIGDDPDDDIDDGFDDVIDDEPGDDIDDDLNDDVDNDPDDDAEDTSDAG